MRPSFFSHLHPPTIPASQSRWRYTLGAGGIAVFLALVIGITGILEMFYYIPTPDQAALSVQTITYLVPFGAIVRNLHYWSAQFFLIVMVAHLVRVVFTGAYAPPRRFNYVLGLALLVCSILLDFTGYILRWDQGIQWALIVGTNLLKSIPWIGSSIYLAVTGSAEVGMSTLVRFYAWHIVGLTLFLVVLSVWHLFHVRRDGGIAVPPPALRTDHSRITRKELLRREFLAALLVGTALLLVSVVWPAPISAPISTVKAITADARAPWFFLWVQEMLKWGEPFAFGIAVPAAVLLVLTLLPYALPRPAPADLGRWLPPSGRAAQIVLSAILLFIAALTALQLLGVG